MKTSLTNFFTYGGIALLALASCNKNDVKVTTNGGSPGTLSTSTTNLVLDKAKVGDTTTAAISFTSSAPSYGFKAAVTTTLQVDAVGDNWKNPASYTLAANDYNMSFTTPVFNGLLLKLNLPAATASKVNVRLSFSLSPSVINYSNVLSITVTPFNLTSWLYTTGNFAGWENPGPLEDSLISVTGNGVYTGIIDFVTPAAPGDDEFLVLPVKGSWTNKYATNDPMHTTSATVAYNGPNNFFAPGEGYYIVTVDINKNTITFQKCDFYSVIGSAPPGTAWSTDTPLKFINDGTNTWEVNNLAMVVGEYKIRQDDAWSNSWGPAAAANTLVSSGAVGDGNIQLTTAGNYNISFIMPPTAFGNSGLATTTYAAVKQ